MKRKANQVTARLPGELLDKLDWACEVTGLDASTIVKACVKAFVEEVESTGEIRLPLAIIPKAKKSPESFPEVSEDAPADESASSGSMRRYQPGEEHFGHRDIGLVAEKKEKEKHS